MARRDARKDRGAELPSGAEVSAPVEISYPFGSDPWYFYGRVTERSVVRELEGKLDPSSTAPAREHVVRQYETHPHDTRDRKILTTVDQDLLRDAPFVPYSKTRRGARVTQLGVLAGLAAGYAVMLAFLFSLLNSTATTASAGVAVSHQAFQWIGFIAAPVVFAVTWAWDRSRMMVATIEIGPWVTGWAATTNEWVLLTNSEKVPVATYAQTILTTDAGVLAKLAEAFDNFGDEVIRNLQVRVESLEDQLDYAHVGMIETRHAALDSILVAGGRRAEGRGGASWALPLVIIATVAVAGTLAYFVGTGIL